jgi:hypothetical protein
MDVKEARDAVALCFLSCTDIKAKHQKSYEQKQSSHLNFVGLGSRQLLQTLGLSCMPQVKQRYFRIRRYFRFPLLCLHDMHESIYHADYEAQESQSQAREAKPFLGVCPFLFRFLFFKPPPPLLSDIIHSHLPSL